MACRARPDEPDLPGDGADGEDWGNQFSDRGGLIEGLWRNVGTLQHYRVAFGYDGAACATRNTAPPSGRSADDAGADASRLHHRAV